MKKFKKTNNFGLDNFWQVNEKQLKEVAKETENKDYRLVEEAIENVILVLEKLGYIEFENDNSELNSSESIFGFVSWLTCRDEKTVFSSSDNSGIAVKLIEKFCKANNLPEVSENWTDNLTHPTE